jgi:hypothetical protein
MKFIHFEITRFFFKIKNWRKKLIVNIFIHNLNLNVTQKYMENHEFKTINI